MRVANLAGRLVIVEDTAAIDVERASEGRFSSDPQAVFERWVEFREWVSTANLPGGQGFDPADLGAPAPRPRQVLAIGLNYNEHAAESGFASPEAEPPVFTKFASCITGPFASVQLPREGHTDWEVELVAIIGPKAENVDEASAWDHVAGLAVGQDVSERILQMAAPSKQFSLGKSYPNFGPIGPWLTTVDEFDNPDDLALGCSINGEEVQKGRTSELIFSVPQLIAKLSSVMPLLPGDIIFTGTPSGVGLGRTPQRWLQAGDELVSYVDGIGEIRNRFVA
jgi:2-keto-4-pentenoate hydratase/2-oxohepta-3-ene-1,7-dioic acid hydratase in catechol pathway